jgi:ribosomal protein L16 Arg81 hydroxylase
LRTWVADNIIIGGIPDDLQRILEGLGIAKEEAAREVQEAANHPYVDSGRKLKSRLERRESLLKTLNHLRKESQKDYLSVEKVPLPPLKDFLRDYYYPNKVGFFKDAIKHWPAAKWTPQVLLQKVGAEVMVEVQFDRDKASHYETRSHEFRRQVKFGDFVNMVEKAGSSNNFYLTANNHAFTNSGLKVLLNDIGNIGDNYIDERDRDSRVFFWFGPRGTVTPLHHDLTNNFFIQVYGSKTMRLIPSLQVPYMYNNLHVFSDIDLLKPKLKEYPEFGKVDIVELNVKAGDCVFIPIGWWHHVVGETTSISLSFTNFNMAQNGFIDFPAGGRY